MAARPKASLHRALSALHGKSPIALFYVTSTEARTLSNEDSVVYRAITSQMSTQLENRRLLESTEQALEETRRLYIATRAISAAQSAEDIYDATVDHLARPLAAATRVCRRLPSWSACPPEPRHLPSICSFHAWSNDLQFATSTRGQAHSRRRAAGRICWWAVCRSA